MKGHQKKYYQLSNKGHEYIKELVKEWHIFAEGINRIIKEGLENKQKIKFLRRLEELSSSAYLIKRKKKYCMTTKSTLNRNGKR